MGITFNLAAWHDYERPDPNSPIVACFGDSWLQYPIPGIGNLANRFLDFGKYQALDIAVLGEIGLEIARPGKSQMMALTTFLQWEGKSVDMLVISGGGNDFAGADDLFPLLQRGDDNDARSWFKPAETKKLFDGIANGYQNILHLRNIFCPQVPIVAHCYDYPQISGKGLLWFSPWILPSLQQIGMPVALHVAAGRYIIDELARLHLALQGADPAQSHYHFIDTRNTLTPVDWSNELHPSRGGFNKLAMKFFPLFQASFPDWVRPPKWSTAPQQQPR
ncbi:hypothetical protein [Janthinobacterium fluminis]|uniref:SGNH/GDSL hydrolase family protein n=1 Tax=Janthinobacterium fluminis TaxID=2987524 RepID=A0ABT5K4I0_9BURK|nr:hypothetical protein [Janthinobacterium fluminis]MDC8759779.1 hypothetical protein [Janthinobacterium fluminis]